MDLTVTIIIMVYYVFMVLINYVMLTFFTDDDMINKNRLYIAACWPVVQLMMLYIGIKRLIKKRNNG